MADSRENEIIDLITPVNEIKKYLKKLNSLISDNSSFIFGSYRFVNKKRVDDIICCIEASWPKELKDIAQYRFEKELNSLKIYKGILENVTNKTFISSDHYLINYNLLVNRSHLLTKALTRELNSMNND